MQGYKVPVWLHINHRFDFRLGPTKQICAPTTKRTKTFTVFVLTCTGQTVMGHVTWTGGSRPKSSGNATDRAHHLKETQFSILHCALLPPVHLCSTRHPSCAICLFRFLPTITRDLNICAIRLDHYCINLYSWHGLVTLAE